MCNLEALKPEPFEPGTGLPAGGPLRHALHFAAERGILGDGGSREERVFLRHARRVVPRTAGVTTIDLDAPGGGQVEAGDDVA